MPTVIPIGPFHPALKESEFFKLYVDGEEVVDVDIRIGYQHRGIEKLSEGMTYEQATFLVERICGICSNIHPLCFVQAVEDIAQIEVPDRARYIRTIIAEFERLHSHLLWLGIAGHLIGFDTLLMWGWKYREPVLDVFEMVCGNRQSYAMNAVGGMRKDIKPEHVPKMLETAGEAGKQVKKVIDMVMGDRVARSRLEGVGVLSKEDAIKYCTVGPTARGSGLKIDTRKDYPYAAYDELSFDIPVRTEGDVMAKTVVRLEEMLQSVSIIEQAIDALPRGEIRVEFKDVPSGEGIGMGEAPRGEDIHYVKSNGTNMPERVKVRPPTFVNLPSLKPMLVGDTLADAIITIGSIDPCFCCTERVTVVDKERDTSKSLTGRELIKLSRGRK
jgi:NADH-quinone oxidoreductase subunit D